MGARQYDALTGQFLSVDPIVEGTSAQQAQGYTYANNNPVTFADPSGLLFGSIVKAVSSAAKSVAKTVSSAVSSTYRAVKSVATSVMQPVVDLVQSAARAYSSGVQAAYRGTASSVSNSWNSVRSGATQVVAQAKTLVKKVDVVGSALKKVAVESYNFAIGDMIRACSGGISLSCGAELAMMTPWGKFAKAGKLAFKVAGKADDAIGATRSMAANAADDVASASNKIYSSRALQRMADEPGPFHNFPGSFDDTIFSQGKRTVVPNYFNKAKSNLGNDSIQYRLPGSLNGRAGTYEIFTRPSVSGRTELTMHRFFRPDH